MLKTPYYVCSFSGGKDSTAMLLRMIELGTYPIDEVIFCDTSVEFPEMYDHIKKVGELVESYGIKFTLLKAAHNFEWFLLDKEFTTRKGQAQKGHSWSFINYRWCTRMLKNDVIDAYLRKLKKKHNIFFYVGIAADEQYRLKRKNNKQDNHLHPLVDWGWEENDCLLYCYEKGYTWGGLYNVYGRCSCWCCPLQGIESARKLWKYHPDLWKILREWDKKTPTSFMPTYSVAMLETRFELEREREHKGLTINPRTKEFRMALQKVFEEKGLKVHNDRF